MSTEVRTPEEFAKRYKTYGDGITPPVSVGNINVFDPETGETFGAYDPDEDYPDTARVIINLNCKTVKSGKRNASMSQPASWNLRWRTGDFVLAHIENGWIQRLMPVTANKAKTLSAAEIDRKIKETVEESKQEETKKAAKESKSSKKAKEEAEAEVVEAVEVEDKPF